MNARISDIRRRPVRHYSPRASSEEKALAYQLYVYECGRNCGEVARRLNVTVDRVAHWAKREDWAAKADAELAQVMPAIVAQTAANLRLGAYTASQRLLAILNDRSKPIPFKEVDALVKAAAIGGFSAVGKSPLPAIPSTANDELTSETQDLDRIIAAHHQRLGLSTDQDQDD